MLTTQLLAPYELGQALLAVAVQQGGERAVDDLFRSPPKTEEQQLDPWTLVVDHQGFLTVPEPELAEGDEELGTGGAFGAVGWLMVLSQRLTAKEALTAVDGWGGDSYRTFERAGVSCVRAHYRADTDADLAQMLGALQAWAAKTPQAPVSVAREERTVVFESCDPGKQAPKVAHGPVRRRARLRADADLPLADPARGRRHGRRRGPLRRRTAGGRVLAGAAGLGDVPAGPAAGGGGAGAVPTRRLTRLPGPGNPDDLSQNRRIRWCTAAP